MSQERLYIYHTFISHGDKNLGMFHHLDEMINQLDYIEEMGFNAIMTNPLFPSKSSHGYDSLTFWGIDSKIGGMEAFIRLLRELEKRNMKLIFDITLAHTGDQHEWFKAFLRGENDFYILKDHISDDISSDMHPTCHHWFAPKNKYILSAFGDLPSLNVESQGYRHELKYFFKFWLGMSDCIGIRCDAILHSRVTAKNHDPIPFIKFVKGLIDEVNPNAIVIAEVWSNSNMTNEPLIYADILGSAFDFTSCFGIMLQALDGKRAEDIKLEPHHYQHNMTTMLCNHDTSRILSMLNGDKNKVKEAIKALIQNTNGNISIYYGTENNLEGHVINGYDLPVRENYDVFDMANVIKDKNSLFYYIKDLIAEDKEKRKHNK